MSPPDPPKIYLNEHISPRLAIQLLSASDDEQFEFAVSEQRAILTFNFSDYVNRHENYLKAGKEHWGIILSTEEKIGILLRRLLRLLDYVSAEELKNRTRWLNEFK